MMTLTSSAFTFHRVLSLLVLVLIWNGYGVESYSGGAGSCIGGQAAVGATHLTNTPVTNTSLADQSASLLIDGQEALPSIPAFKSGTLINVEVFSATTTMKGCLIRFSVPDGTSKDIMTVAPTSTSTDIQVAPVCDSTTDAVGVTHTDATPKASCACTFQLSQDSPVTIDITIVIQNQLTGSTYAYNQYLAGSAAPSPSPGGGGVSSDEPTSKVSDIDTVNDIMSDFPSPSNSEVATIMTPAPTMKITEMMTDGPTTMGPTIANARGGEPTPRPTPAPMAPKPIPKPTQPVSAAANIKITSSSLLLFLSSSSVLLLLLLLW